MTYQRSPEQQAFRQMLLEQPAQSIILDAKAGSGKTSTLIDSLDVLSQTGSILLMAFNKKISLELEQRLLKLSSNVRLNTTVGTCHSIGLRAFPKGGTRPRIQGGKLNFLLQDQLEEQRCWQKKDDPRYEGRHLIKRLVSLAKNSGFGVSCPSERFPRIEDLDDWLALAEHFGLELELDQVKLSLDELVTQSLKLLKRSNESESMIDFDDMIYLPLLRNYKVTQYANVLIDEAQDTNATRRELAFRSLRPGGRLIAVGDPHQAIYGFTGADANALTNIAKRSAAITLPLSVCWRCDEKIIEHAQRWVAGIRSHDTEGRGSVTSVPFDESFLDLPAEGDAILCRLNRPNVAVAIALLRRGKRARIEGRDLGERLLKHAKQASPNQHSLAEIQLDLEPYLQHSVNLLIAHEKETEAALLEDEVDALHVLIERCLEQGKKSLIDLELLCQELFQDEAHKQRCILLSSIHKAKGLEWPRVFLLGRSDYMPFFKAEQPWELEQENNLIYVAVTRAAHELIEVTDVRSALDKGLHRAAPSARPKHALPAAPDRSADGTFEQHEDGLNLQMPAFLNKGVS